MNKNDIRLLTCNNLFITYYTIKKNQATKLKYKKALTADCKAILAAKAILPAKFDAHKHPMCVDVFFIKQYISNTNEDKTHCKDHLYFDQLVGLPQGE